MPRTTSEYSAMNEFYNFADFRQVMLSSDPSEIRSVLGRMQDKNSYEAQTLQAMDQSYEDDIESYRRYNPNMENEPDFDPSILIKPSQRLKEYLELLLQTNEKVSRLEVQKNDLARQSSYLMPELRQTREGWELPVHMKAKQFTNNGCWSVSMGVLLQSAGIDMDQEEIRAFRPHLTKAARDNILSAKTSKEQGLLVQGQETEWDVMTSDVRGSVFDYSDLILRTVPNTGVRNISYYPITEQNKKAIAEEIMENAIEALENQHSSVSILAGGHYRSIVGYNRETGELKVEDSLKDAPSPYWVKASELVDDVEFAEMTWLQRLKVEPNGKVTGIPKAFRGISYEKGNLDAGGSYIPQDGNMQSESKALMPLEQIENRSGALLNREERFVAPARLVAAPEILARQTGPDNPARGQAIVIEEDKRVINQQTRLRHMYDDAVGAGDLANDAPSLYRTMQNFAGSRNIALGEGHDYAPESAEYKVAAFLGLYGPKENDWGGDDYYKYLDEQLADLQRAIQDKVQNLAAGAAQNQVPGAAQNPVPGAAQNPAPGMPQGAEEKKAWEDLAAGISSFRADFNRERREAARLNIQQNQNRDVNINDPAIDAYLNRSAAPEFKHADDQQKGILATLSEHRTSAPIPPEEKKTSGPVPPEEKKRTSASVHTEAEKTSMPLPPAEAEQKKTTKPTSLVDWEEGQEMNVPISPAEKNAADSKNSAAGSGEKSDEKIEKKDVPVPEEKQENIITSNSAVDVKNKTTENTFAENSAEDVPQRNEAPDDYEKWFESFEWELKKYGVDTYNPYALANILVDQQKKSENMRLGKKPGDTEARKRPTELETLLNIIRMDRNTKDYSSYAFMNVDKNGSYRVPRPDSGDSIGWMTKNMQNFSTASTRLKKHLYEMAKQNRLYIREPNYKKSDRQCDYRVIRVNPQSGKAELTRSFKGDYDGAEHFYQRKSVDYKGTRRDALLTPEEESEIRKTSSERNTIAAMSSMNRRGDGFSKYAEWNQYVELNKVHGVVVTQDMRDNARYLLKGLQPVLDSDPAYIEKQVAAVVVNHPDWTDTPEKLAEVQKYFRIVDKADGQVTPEEKQFKQEHREFDDNVGLAIGELVKLTGLESLEDIMRFGKVRTPDGKTLPTTDTREFTRQVSRQLDAKVKNGLRVETADGSEKLYVMDSEYRFREAIPGSALNGFFRRYHEICAPICAMPSEEEPEELEVLELSDKVEDVRAGIKSLYEQMPKIAETSSGEQKFDMTEYVPKSTIGEYEILFRTIYTLVEKCGDQKTLNPQEQSILEAAGQILGKDYREILKEGREKKNDKEGTRKKDLKNPLLEEAKKVKAMDSLPGLADKKAAAAGGQAAVSGAKAEPGKVAVPGAKAEPGKVAVSGAKAEPGKVAVSGAKAEPGKRTISLHRKDLNQYRKEILRLSEEMKKTDSVFSNDSASYRNVRHELESSAKFLSQKENFNIHNIQLSLEFLQNTCKGYMDAHKDLSKFSDRQQDRLKIMNRILDLNDKFRSNTPKPQMQYEQLIAAKIAQQAAVRYQEHPESFKDADTKVKRIDLQSRGKQIQYDHAEARKVTRNIMNNPAFKEFLEKAQAKRPDALEKLLKTDSSLLFTKYRDYIGKRNAELAKQQKKNERELAKQNKKNGQEPVKQQKKDVQEPVKQNGQGQAESADDSIQLKF